MDAGIRDIALGIGGSATTDGGAGLLRALGATVGEGCDAVDLAGLDPRLAEVRLRIACDVTNPLLGPDGAAAVYGPQKGATPELVAALDARLARWADALEAATGRERARHPRCRRGRRRSGSRCSRSRTGSRTCGSQPGIDLVMAEARLRRGARRGRPRDHRRGPDRRADGVRQDGDGRRAAGAGGRQALPRDRRRGDARGRSRRWRRSARSRRRQRRARSRSTRPGPPGRDPIEAARRARCGQAG